MPVNGRGGPCGSTAADAKKPTPPCPTCGRSDFVNEQYMKIHHARVHGESIAGVETTCIGCGGTFRVKPSHEGDRQHCSHQCAMEHLWDGRRGENSPFYKERVQVECEWCGEEERVIPWRAREYKFCSTDCHNEYLSNQNGENHYNWNRVELECDWCDGTFTAVKSHAEYRRFCSYECKGEWQSEHLNGENNPAYKGGVSYDYAEPRWRRIRAEVIVEYNRVCQSCSTHEDDLEESLNVHHVIPARKFDDLDNAHDKDNLVPLCDRCHNRWEGIPLKPELLI